MKRVILLAGLLAVFAGGPGPDVWRPGTALAAHENESARRDDRQRAAALLTALWTAQFGRTDLDWAASDRRQVWAAMALRALAADAAGVGRSRNEDAGVQAPVAPEPPDPLDAGAAEPTVFAAPAEGFFPPAPGRVTAAFAPQANPPRQGIVLAASRGETVAAAAEGLVVFVGALRGLGRVVIVSHGARRHTVYGCLEQAAVREGTMVARGDALGQAGYCGLVKAPGVYFELRFREKALNPAEWLAMRR